MPASRFQFDLVANVGRFRRGFRLADRAVRGLGDRLGFLKSKVAAAGGALAAFFGARALVSGVESVVDEAASLEEGMARIKAATGAADDDIARLREEAIRLGETTQFRATQAAGAIENLGRAGLSTAQTLQAVPKVLQLATAADLGLAESASIVTKAVVGFNLQFAETGRVTDVLVEASQNANTNIRNLGQGLSLVAPIAATNNITLETTVGLIAQLQGAGLDATRAGTALRKILIDLNNPTSTFAKGLRQANIESTDLFTVLGKLSQGGTEAEAAINAIGTEALPGLQILLQKVSDGGLKQFIEQLENSKGAAKEAANTIRGTFNFAKKELSSAFNTFQRGIGEAAFKPIQRQIESLSGDLRALSQKQLARLGTAIGDTFTKGANAVRDFLSEFTVKDAVTQAKKALDGLGNSFQRIGNLADKVVGATQIAFNAITVLFNGVATAVFAAAQTVAQQVATTIGLLNRLGLASDETLKRAQAQVEIYRDSFNEAAQRVQQDLNDIKSGYDRFADASRAAADAQDNLADSAGQGGDATKESGEKAKEAAASYEELAGITKELTDALSDDKAEKTQKAVTAALRNQADQARQAAAQAKDNLDELRTSSTATQEEINQAEFAYRKATIAAAQATEQFASESGKAQKEANRLVQALDNLGVKSQASLNLAAESAREAFQTVANEGGPQEIARAFEAYADKAIAANGGVASSYLKAQAKALGLEGAIKGVGDASEESGKKASAAAKSAGDAATQASESAQEAAQKSISSGRRSAQGIAAVVGALRAKYREVGEGAVEAFNGINRKAAQGLTTIGNYFDELARRRDRLDQQVQSERDSLAQMQRVIAESKGSTADLAQIASFTTDQFELLGESQLSGLRSAIDSAKSKLDSMRDSAEGTLSSLNEELLQLQGRDAELARVRNQQRREELRSQLGQAQAAGDSRSVATLQQAIAKFDQVATLQAQQAQQRRRQQDRPRGEPERTVKIEGPDDSATVRATDSDAEKLIQQIQRAGLRTR